MNVTSPEVLGSGAAVVAILIFVVQFLTRFIINQQRVITEHIRHNTESNKALRTISEEQVRATREQTAVFQELLGYLKAQKRQ